MLLLLSCWYSKVTSVIKAFTFCQSYEDPLYFWAPPQGMCWTRLRQQHVPTSGNSMLHPILHRWWLWRSTGGNPCYREGRQSTGAKVFVPSPTRNPCYKHKSYKNNSEKLNFLQKQNAMKSSQMISHVTAEYNTHACTRYLAITPYLTLMMEAEIVPEV